MVQLFGAPGEPAYWELFAGGAPAATPGGGRLGVRAFRADTVDVPAGLILSIFRSACPCNGCWSILWVSRTGAPILDDTTLDCSEALAACDTAGEGVGAFADTCPRSSLACEGIACICACC